MREELIKIVAEDGVILHGQFWQPKTKSNKIIIHNHGMAGNFYENDFIFDMAKEYTKHGYAFLSCNNRGHDYIADIVQVNSDGFKGGAAYEVFKECIKDIDAYVSFAQARGYTNLILQGHSSGANKVAFWASRNRENKNLMGIVLISPCDDIGLNIEELGYEKYKALIEKAHLLMLSNKGDDMMPDGTFYDYPVSAKTYFSNFSQGAEFDIFHYRDINKNFDTLSAICVPILVTFGNKNEFLLQDSSFVEHKVYKTLYDCKFYVIDGANHSYLGKSKDLINLVLSWMKEYE